MEIWLISRARVREKTLRGYTAHMRLHLVPHLGQVLLAELDTGHLDRAFTALLRHDGVSAATACRVLATLRSALNAAVREKLIADNPGPLPAAAARAAPPRGGVDPALGKGMEADRPAASGRGVDPGADRGVPELHQRPLAVRRLSPDRAKGAAPRLAALSLSGHPDPIRFAAEFRRPAPPPGGPRPPLEPLSQSEIRVLRYLQTNCPRRKSRTNCM
jgi:hypothetical protein